MIDRNFKDISLLRQAILLQVSRSSLYYIPVIQTETLDIMNAIDEIFTELPFYGSRKMKEELLRRRGIDIGRHRVRRLMSLMGLEAIYPKPNFSKKDKEHKVYPYLLKGLKIEHPNHVWGTDITYIRLEQGFLYLMAIMDWFSRFIISFRLSNTLDVHFCKDALEEAIGKGKAKIHNSDQGSQFTSDEYTAILQAHDIAISMDSRGRCMDNIFNERLWRSVKYEEVYIKSYQTPKEAHEGLKNYFDFYNYRRVHQALGYKTPAEVYFG